MIFVLRVIIFSALILFGLYVSSYSIRLRKIITVIYTFVLLWYTLLCRLPLFTSVPVAADSTITTTPATEPSLAERLIETMIAVCTNGLLALALVPKTSKETLACRGNLYRCKRRHRTAPRVDRTRYG